MNKLYINLYKQAYKIRAVEEEISKRYNKEKMRCPIHLSIGQEAVSAAFSQVVKKSDFAVSTHRAHAHYLAKGGALKKLIAEIYGKKTGCSKGKGGSMHLIDLDVNFMGTSAIVGNSIPIGVGLGLSEKLLNKKNLSTIFIGEGATEEGVFFESINFAIVKELPVLFICENNLYSVYSSLKDRQPKNRKIYQMIKSLGAKASICDGNNALECYNSISKAYKYVKAQSKPFFLAKFCIQASFSDRTFPLKCNFQPSNLVAETHKWTCG